MKLRSIWVWMPAALLSAGVSHAQSDATRMQRHGWYGSLYGTFSSLPASDVRETRPAVPDMAGSAKFGPGLGFGGAVGKQFEGSPYALELAWDYQSAPLRSVGGQTVGGDYAANIFWLNGYRRFESQSKWTPYIGAGLAYVQEIDMDIERSGQTAEYSRYGGLGVQAIAGVQYAIDARWSLMGDVKYMRIGKTPHRPSMDGSALTLGSAYTPMSIHLGLVRRF